MQYLVRQEAGPEYDALGKRLEKIAAVTAPLVTAVTGLPMPESVVIRTMTVHEWKQAHRRSSEHLLRTEALQLGATSRTKARLRRRIQLAVMNRMWPVVLGQSVPLEPGHPELVILPEALKHAGRLDDDPVLHKILGHEMTHLAQDAAGDGTVWTAQDTYFPDLRGIADRDYHFLLEGHAYWADQQITTRLYGTPVCTDKPSPYASARYLKLFNSRLRTQIVEVQRRATDSVARIIATEGLDAFNRVWTTPTLVPLKSETSTPELWRRRFGPHPAG
ncbi:hypothetical protein IAG44_39770 [Streptomyces roseirectus]|uniref:Uncharacterized protein n=1 Tax=Streptomyces roseirectus TaxID=2768066 RepID=A0A7H0IQ90_9ACTN|nr:hypothetical protein [Streptomyces roseirectus]QNP74956.1 hypothetical protein IAG44_39770 [Streptomyces roseirectus]